MGGPGQATPLLAVSVGERRERKILVGVMG